MAKLASRTGGADTGRGVNRSLELLRELRYATLHRSLWIASACLLCLFPLR
ncbi:hypothetical protein J2803_000873 [Paraburkholderia phenoliruptrix]|nr:hypothetical protein [Paraburkholderia phenoliruptrix]